ncbi:MAG: hypothetical protein K2W94_04445 [Alphaproteobacteria bacterium]|nr:hypothetical protein [Alphaproteobacteria bacterium]
MNQNIINNLSKIFSNISRLSFIVFFLTGIVCSFDVFGGELIEVQGGANETNLHGDGEGGSKRKLSAIASESLVIEEGTPQHKRPYLNSGSLRNSAAGRVGGRGRGRGHDFRSKGSGAISRSDSGINSSESVEKQVQSAAKQLPSQEQLDEDSSILLLSDTNPHTPGVSKNLSLGESSSYKSPSQFDKVSVEGNEENSPTRSATPELDTIYGADKMNESGEMDESDQINPSGKVTKFFVNPWKKVKEEDLYAAIDPTSAEGEMDKIIHYLCYLQGGDMQREIISMYPTISANQLQKHLADQAWAAATGGPLAEILGELIDRNEKIQKKCKALETGNSKLEEKFTLQMTEDRNKILQTLATALGIPLTNTTNSTLALQELKKEIEQIKKAKTSLEREKVELLAQNAKLANEKAELASKILELMQKNPSSGAKD